MRLTRRTVSEDYSAEDLDAIVVGGMHAQCDGEKITLA